MITVTQGNNGYTIAHNGTVIARDLTHTQAEELHRALSATLWAEPAALTPAKYLQRARRTKPPILSSK